MRIIDCTQIAKITLESEGITDWILECVDLDIEHSPVVPIPGDDHGHAVEAIKTMGGRYMLNPPCSLYPPGYTFSADELKIMRARYLLRLKEEQSIALNAWLKERRGK
jgi:hypothetical protein